MDSFLTLLVPSIRPRSRLDGSTPRYCFVRNDTTKCQRYLPTFRANNNKVGKRQIEYPACWSLGLHCNPKYRGSCSYETSGNVYGTTLWGTKFSTLILSSFLYFSFQVLRLNFRFSIYFFLMRAICFCFVFSVTQ
jgi:hypothetical protein